MPLQESVAAAQKRKSLDPQAPPVRRESGANNPVKSPKSPGLSSPMSGARSPGFAERPPHGGERRGSTGGAQTPCEGGLVVPARRSIGGRQSPTTPMTPTAPNSVSPGLKVVNRKRSPSMRKEVLDDDGNIIEATNNVKVVLRVRPFNEREIRIHEEHFDSQLRSIIDMPEGPYGHVHFLERTRGEEEGDQDYNTVEIFDFDRCLWSIYPEQQEYDHAFCSQRDLYEILGAPALENAWAGFNTCIFAYGQTGAGKTHTMMGPFTTERGSITSDAGIIPQLCKELYVSIDARKSREEHKEKKLITVDYETELCAYEIYNEKVRDLFFTHTPGRKAKDELRVRKHPLDGPFVDGISKLCPHDWEECVSDIVDGNAQRTTGATAMNSESSRSHSVFQIKFTQIETSIPTQRFEKPIINRKYSVINLIDLAGSERNKKSMATGERLTEATNINLSLTTLKRVIDALVYNSQNPKAQKQVPYRDSVLTMLLSHSLGGNSKTMMVACVSPHYDNSEETLNTLRYASQARKIVNVVRVNEDTKAKANLLLKEQLANLQNELEHRREGDWSPKQIEELEDEIRAGQEALEHYEEEAAKLRQEKEEEIEKRYHQAFQHSFQMVILRKQKEQAQLAALNAEKAKAEYESQHRSLAQMQRENSALRHVRDEHKQKEMELKSEIEKSRAKQDEILTKAYGLQWVEKQKRILAEKNAQKAMAEAEKAHKNELDAVIEAASKEYSELADAFKKKEKGSDKLQRESEESRMSLKGLKQENQTLAAKADEYKKRCQKLEDEYDRKFREQESRHRHETDTVKNRLVIEVESLKRELDEQTRINKSTQDRLSRDEEDRRETIQFQHRRELQRNLDDIEARRKAEREEHREEIAVLQRQHFEEVKTLKAKLQKQLDEQYERYENLLEEYKHKVNEQISVLNDVARREVRYRDTHHQLESALERTAQEDTEAGASRDLKDFLKLCRSYVAELVSNPINRAAVSRAAMNVTAFVSKAPPCVGHTGEELGSPTQALNGEHSNGRSPSPGGRLVSRSPARRTVRKTKPSSSSPTTPGSPARNK